MNCARPKFQMALAALLAALVAFSPAFAEPDDAEVAIDGASPPANAAQPAADAALALDASALSAAFNASGVSSYKCRTALKDFEKAVADANAAAVAQRAKVAEVARKYLTDSLEKARTAGDLDKVLVFQKALETVDGEIAGDAEEIVKLRNGRAAQLDKIDKGLVASGLTAAKTLDAHLELQKKEITQKGEIETALKVAAFQKRVEEWAKKTRDAASAHFSATTGGRTSSRATSEVRRPAAPVRQPVRETRPAGPEARTVTIDANNMYGASIGKVNVGDTIEIQYVGGKWTAGTGGGYALAESPDETSFEKKKCLLISRGNPAYIVARIPSGTRDIPFRYSITDEADAMELAIRIGDSDGRNRRDYDDNAGSVRYSVRIIPAGGRASPRAASEVRRPAAQPASPDRLPTSAARFRPSVEPETKIVTIDARSENGTSIGPVNAGDTIEIQYVGGKWYCGAHISESPDDEAIWGQHKCRLINRGNPPKTLAAIPSGTKEEPFRYIVDENDGDSFSLAIEDRSYNDNSGSVRYSVRIIPAGGRASPRATATVDSRPPASTTTPSSASGRFSNQALTGTQTETSVTFAKTLAPHVIRDQYFVPEGKELIVEAGATIIFEKDASLYCEGTLKIQGMETAPVVFKGKMSKKGYWKGVEIKGGASSVEFASISDAQIGVLVNGKNTMVKCCRLMNSESGVALRWDGRPSIVDNCTFYNNTVGIRWENSHGSSVRNCSFLNNDDCGLILWNPFPSEGIAAANCVFSGNKHDGIRGHIHCAREASIKNCSFSNNGRFDVDIGPFPKLDCRQNYWGPSVTRLLQQRGVDTNLPNIKDGRDSGRGNIVDVAEFLTEPPKDCGATVRW